MSWKRLRKGRTSLHGLWRVHVACDTQLVILPIVVIYLLAFWSFKSSNDALDDRNSAQLMACGKGQDDSDRC